jgi:hypothetical protein
VGYIVGLTIIVLIAQTQCEILQNCKKSKRDLKERSSLRTAGWSATKSESRTTRQHVEPFLACCVKKGSKKHIRLYYIAVPKDVIRLFSNGS